MARKLFTFWTPKGLYWYKQLVMTNNPASLECHRWAREVVKECKGVAQIKDNILVHDMEDMHEGTLGKVLHKLQEAGFTLRRVKWELGSGDGRGGVVRAPLLWDHAKRRVVADKANIIRQLPRPVTVREVESLLVMLQFNAVYLAAKKGKKT